MSSSSKKATIRLSSGESPAELKLIDHQFKTVAYGYGSLEKKVSPGLYQLEISAGTSQTREFISLKPGEEYTREDLDVPFMSTAPVASAVNSHEYQGYPAQELSRNPNQHFGAGGRLVIFFRNTGKDSSIPINIDSYSLLTADFEPLCNLQDAVIREAPSGWIALSAEVDPGGYILRNTQEWSPESHRTESRTAAADLPIWVESEWITLAFVPNWADRHSPSLAQTSIHMATIGMGFDYDNNQLNASMEMALNGLKQGRPLLPSDILQYILDEKFSNPMLGIVGAQSLLLETKPRWGLFDIVRKNLKKLIPNHPDVIALFVMGKERRGNVARSRVTPVSFPPMLNGAYRGLITRDAEEPGIIAPNTLAEQAASRLYRQGPWSLWKPFDFSEADDLDPNFLQSFAEIETLVDNPDISISDNLRQIFDEAQAAPATKTTSVSDPAVKYVAQYIQQSAREGVSSQRGEVVSPQSMQLQNLSRQVGLPVSSVTRAIQTIAKKRRGGKR